MKEHNLNWPQTPDYLYTEYYKWRQDLEKGIHYLI